MTFLGKTAGLALVLGLAGGQAAVAQAIPAEFPPSSYEGSQYVDSNGCAFVRAGMDGRVNWIPRVDRRRDQLCNFQPTFAQAPAPEAAPVAAAPVVTASAVPAPAARPAPTPRVAPVIRSVAAPSVSAPVAPRVAPSPRVIAAPAPQPRRITLAEACEGRFGVQPGFVSAQTGNPINCGPQPIRTAAVTPRSVTPGRATAPQPLRLTLDQACLRIAAGANLVTTDGTPIACPDAAPIRVAQAMTMPGRTMPASVMTAPLMVPRGIPASNANACTISWLASSPGARCGPQAVSPSGQVARSIASPSTATISTRNVRTAQSGSVAAVTAPVVAARAAAVPLQTPAGYARVWDDGRINSQRGLPAN